MIVVTCWVAAACESSRNLCCEGTGIFVYHGNESRGFLTICGEPFLLTTFCCAFIQILAGLNSIKAAVKVWNYQRSSAKEHPSKENSNILNKNFDLSVTDHIGQLLQ